jgi:predicted nucleic acid-binding protein
MKQRKGMQRTAVIDTDALSKLRDLGLLNQLRNIFEVVFVPEKVKDEYEHHVTHKMDTKGAAFIFNLTMNSFFQLCTSYDKFVVVNLQLIKHIDPGEAEALAQQKKISADMVLSDDGRFRRAALKYDKTLRILNVLDILVALDLQGQLPDVKSELLRLLESGLRFSSPDVQKSYQKIADYFHLSLDKKSLQSKVNYARETLDSFRLKSGSIVKD